MFAGRRNGDKLAPLVAEIEAAGGRCVARSLDARKEEDVAAFIARGRRARAARGLHLQRRRQRQLSRRWKPPSACSARSGRWPATPASSPAARRRARCCRTGAARSSSPARRRACAAAAATPPSRPPRPGCARSRRAMARELGPKNIHVAHLVIDAGVDTAWVRERIGERGGADARASCERRTS